MALLRYVGTGWCGKRVAKGSLVQQGDESWTFPPQKAGCFHSPQPVTLQGDTCWQFVWVGISKILFCFDRCALRCFYS